MGGRGRRWNAYGFLRKVAEEDWLCYWFVDYDGWDIFLVCIGAGFSPHGGDWTSHDGCSVDDAEAVNSVIDRKSACRERVF